MENFISSIRFIHILSGCIALIAGLGAIFFRKKTKTHRPFGKVYFWCMSIIFVTAIYLSVLKSNIFLLCVACFSYYACLTAYRSLQLKKLHKGHKAKKIDWIIEVCFGLMHLAFIGFALYLFSRQNTSYAIISLVFGLIGIRSNYVTIKRLRGNLTHKSYWLMAHAGGMTGSYIATITAFTVNNNQWIGMPNIIAWLGPTALLVPFIVLEINRIKKEGGLLKN